MGVLGTFDDHDPRDLLDYTIRWVTWLAGDQITGSSWTAPANNPDSGMIINQSTFTTGTATIWLASGTVDKTYRFDNLVGTLGGRRKSKSILIKVGDR